MPKNILVIRGETHLKTESLQTLIFKTNVFDCNCSGIIQKRKYGKKVIFPGPSTFFGRPKHQIDYTISHKIAFHFNLFEWISIQFDFEHSAP